MPTPPRAVPVVAPPSVDEFERRYVRPKQPVILRGLIEDWPINLWWADGPLAAVVRAAELFQRARKLSL